MERNGTAIKNRIVNLHKINMHRYIILEIINIKRVNNKIKISLRRLSEISSISHSYLSELEKGKYEATESKIIRLSLALGITPNELLGWEEIIDNLKSNLNNFI